MSALFVTRITYLLYVCYSSPTQMHEITVQSVVCYYCPSAVPVLSYYSNVRRKFYSIKRVSLFWALGIGGIGGSLYTGSLQLETGFLLSIAFNFLVSLIQSSLVSLSWDLALLFGLLSSNSKINKKITQSNRCDKDGFQLKLKSQRQSVLLTIFYCTLAEVYLLPFNSEVEHVLLGQFYYLGIFPRRHSNQ